MKSISNIVSIWILLAVFSCNNDKNKIAPQITLDAPKLIDGVYEASENEKILINVKIEAPGGFNALRVTFEGINRAPEEIPKKEPGQTTINIDYQMENWFYGSAPFEISFIAVDDSNSSSEAKVTVTPGEPSIVILEDNPDVSGDSVIAFVGQQYNVRYRYSFPAGLVRFKNTFSVDGNVVSESITTELPPTQGTSVTDAVSQILSVEFLGKELAYQLELTDKFSNVVTLALPVKLSQKPTTKFNSITLEVPASDKSSNSFFSANTGLVYSVDDVNESSDIPVNIDFGYFFTLGENAAFTGPANFPTNIYNVGPNGDKWSPLNVSNFRRTSLSVSDFDALNEESQNEIDDAYENATGGTELLITSLVEGEVVAFKTSSNKPTGSKHGLFKVVSITPGTTTGGKIVIDVIANQ